MVEVSALTRAEALRKIETVCKRRGIKRLASVKLGYEDEGPALDQWRSTGGRVAKLTIHCPLPGDAVSFVPFADSIE